MPRTKKKLNDTVDSAASSDTASVTTTSTRSSRRGRPPKRYQDEGYATPVPATPSVPKKRSNPTPASTKKGRPPQSTKIGRGRRNKPWDDDGEEEYPHADYESRSDDESSEEEDLKLGASALNYDDLDEDFDMDGLQVKMEADADEKFQGSSFCPWVDLDPKDIPPLELPVGSDDIPVPGFLLMDVVELYEILRSYHRTLRLTPFAFEDFCAALMSPDNSCILAETHIALLKMCLRNDDDEQVHYSVNDTNNAFNVMIHCIETMTYAEVLRQYIEAYPGVDEGVRNAMNTPNYPYVDIEQRVVVLLFLCYRFLYSHEYKKVVNNGGKFVNDETCRVCGKSAGGVTGCTRCEASFHVNCMGTTPDEIFVCNLCKSNSNIRGATDAIPFGEIMERQPMRMTPIGRDRHGRLYWFVCRRLFVQSAEDETQVRYYSSAPQLLELLKKFDADYYERDLCSFIQKNTNVFFEHMSFTVEMTLERRERVVKELLAKGAKGLPPVLTLEEAEAAIPAAYLHVDNLQRMSKILRDCPNDPVKQEIKDEADEMDDESVIKKEESLVESTKTLLGIYDGRLANCFWTGNVEEINVIKFTMNGANLEPFDGNEFWRMGSFRDDNVFNEYVNQYSSNDMAENAQMRKKMGDRKKYMCTRFSLYEESHWSFEWSTARGKTMYGNARMHAKYIEWTIAKLVRKIPPELMHRQWMKICDQFDENLKAADTYDKLSEQLMILDAYMRRTLFLPQWWNSLGHTQLNRTTVEQREIQSKELQRKKKEEKDIFSNEVEDLVRVNYAKTGTVSQALLRQKGELYRYGNRGEMGGWEWYSSTFSRKWRPVPEKPPLGLTADSTNEETPTLEARKARRLERLVRRIQDKKTATTPSSSSAPLAFLQNCYSPSCNSSKQRRLVCYAQDDTLPQSCYSAICRSRWREEILEASKKKPVVGVIGEDLPWPAPKPQDFMSRGAKKRSLLVISQKILRKLIVTAGRSPIYIPGFSSTAKSNFQVWNYPCLRPTFDLCWRWLTLNSRSLHAVALQLRILWASIRWLDMEPEDNDPDRRFVAHFPDHDQRRWIIKHKEYPPMGTYERYLLRIEIIPLEEEEEEDEAWSNRNENRLLKSRTSSRKRKPNKSRKPKYEKEEWLDGIDLKLYEIKDYWEKVNDEKENKKSKKPGFADVTPSNPRLPVQRVFSRSGVSTINGVPYEERKRRPAPRALPSDYVYASDPQYEDDSAFLSAPPAKRRPIGVVSIGGNAGDQNFRNLTVREAIAMNPQRAQAFLTNEAASRRTSNGYEFPGGMIRGGGRAVQTTYVPVGDGSNTMRRVTVTTSGGGSGNQTPNDNQQVAEEAVGANNDQDDQPPVIPRFERSSNGAVTQQRPAPVRQIVYTTPGQQQTRPGSNTVYVLKRPAPSGSTPIIVRSANGTVVGQDGQPVQKMAPGSVILQPSTGGRVVMRNPAQRPPIVVASGGQNVAGGTRIVRVQGQAPGRFVQQMGSDQLVHRMVYQPRQATNSPTQEYDSSQQETYQQPTVKNAYLVNRPVTGQIQTQRGRGGATMQMAQQQQIYYVKEEEYPDEQYDDFGPPQ